MVSHVLFDFFGTLVTYAPHGPDHDFSRSHRTGREFAMRDLAAEFLRQAMAREPTAEEAGTMAGAYLADWDTCVRYLPC